MIFLIQKDPRRPYLWEQIYAYDVGELYIQTSDLNVTRERLRQWCDDARPGDVLKVSAVKVAALDVLMARGLFEPAGSR